MRNKIIPYGRHDISQKDIDAVVEVLKSDFLTQGPNIQLFEKKFADYVGSKYAVAVSNATAALHIATLSLEIKPGDKIITTPITFIASANCIRYSGAEVVFVDIDPETYLIDLNKLKNLLDKHPIGTFKGVIAVDFAGRSINLELLNEIAQDFKLWVIEDACHAPGAFFINSKNEKIKCGSGHYTDLSVFSFHPVKHIACGEGGMITTNNEELFKKLVNLRTHGIQQFSEKKIKQNEPKWYYEMQELGYNYRLTDIQAALGKSQLERAEEGLAKRKNIAKKYSNYFSNKKYIKRQSGLIIGHAYHLYIIEIDFRDELYEYLRTKNIYTQVHYIPCHLMPYYQSLGWHVGDMPNAEKFYSQCLTLPIFPKLEEMEIDYILENINNFYFGR